MNIAFSLNGQLHSDTARWWFVPHWHQGDVSDWTATTFNAKIETAAQKPSFRDAWRTGRCVIPVSGYYEWSGSKGRKQPWYISLKNNAPVFFFAGLYSDLNAQKTCTILTRPAAPDLTDLHPRMPVILGPGEISPWLSGDNSTDIGQASNGQLAKHTVRRFGIKDDGPQLIEPDGFDL